MTKQQVSCAVYTRKSSEEGLEQSFNSLEAQREACIAYIHSQKHEGWLVANTRYDDGGFSGGTMERPALQQLLDHIAAGKIATVIVYKVDRLTRSLADFAKIIEVFDSHHVSFVSVTQQFNTTTSMGRLTLNVLLSFAQFERELTGERIRDKVAASKKKGMWMGGIVPLGYDCVDHRLIVNPPEDETVREIFRQYLRLGCVKELKDYLGREQINSKVRTSGNGRTSGGASYSRGALYHLLNNRVYIGETVHREQSYPGHQEAIVPRELWDQVVARLAANNQAHRSKKSLATPSLLSGIVFNVNGVRLTAPDCKPVSLFFSLGAVSSENSILPPRTGLSRWTLGILLVWWLSLIPLSLALNSVWRPYIWQQFVITASYLVGVPLVFRWVYPRLFDRYKNKLSSGLPKWLRALSFVEFEGDTDEI